MEKIKDLFLTHKYSSFLVFLCRKQLKIQLDKWPITIFLPSPRKVLFSMYGFIVLIKVNEIFKKKNTVKKSAFFKVIYVHLDTPQ